jgi:hypothetical protein
LLLLLLLLLHREPQRSPGPLPLHLVPLLARSLQQDSYVPDKGDVVFYTNPAEEAAAAAAAAGKGKAKAA